MQNILLLSSGSKVALTRIAAHACQKRGIALHAIDRQSNVPTQHFVDFFETQEKTLWPTSVLEYCRLHNIGLLIPTRHSDLPIFSQSSGDFSRHGVQIGVSSPETIRICTDKLLTHDFLERRDIPTPRTTRLSKATDLGELGFPLVVKPVRGSSSVNVHVAANESAIPASCWSGEYLAQSLAHGVEYTINVYVSREGKCVCAIPHRRIVVDGGESVQAVTERIPLLIELGHSVAEALPGAWGPLNIQAFYDPETGQAQITDLNPRLGGGYPLVDKAGGTFIEWLVKESLEGIAPKACSDWTSGLRMMRYREAIFDHPAN